MNRKIKISEETGQSRSSKGKIRPIQACARKQHAASEQEDKENIEVMNETVTRLILEAAYEVGDKAPIQAVGKISQVIKYLIKKPQNIEVPNSRVQVEFAELSKLVNENKVRDIRNYNVEKIEEAVKYGRSMKSVKIKLVIGQGEMYALKDKQGNVISNVDGIVKAAEVSHSDLHSTQSSQATFIRSSDEQDTKAPSLTNDEVRRDLQDVTREKLLEEME